MKVIFTYLRTALSNQIPILLALVLFGNQASAQVCSDPINTIYGLNGSGTLYPININTGNVGTAMTPSYTGNSPSQANGLSLNIINGRFYYFKRNPSSSPGEFVSYDPATGTVTLLASCPTTNTIHTGCITADGKGYYCNDVNGNFYYYNVLTDSWVLLTGTIYDNFGTNISSVIAARTSGDMCMDGLGNLWFVCSGSGTYGLYEFKTPLPTGPVASMTATQIIDPNTAMPSSTGFQGAAFSPVGELYLATGNGDNKLYKLSTYSTLDYVATFSLGGVGNDLTSCNFPFGILPVTWKNFTASQQSDAEVLLNWTLSQETNCKGYHVERKGENDDWQEIGFVASQGNSNTAVSYQFIDYTPSAGNNYYRIRQEDWDGRSSYSGVRLVKANSGAGLSIWPNPATDNIRIGLSSSSGEDARGQVYDLSGRKLQQFVLHPGTNTITISNLPSGSYLLRVRTNQGTQFNQKLIKK